jgi:predicted amino acid racemase
MSAPRLEIDLDKIRHNARTLVARLAGRGISVTGVTKATLGSPAVAGALLGAGVSVLGDSRIENIEAMRRAQVPASMTLVRAPMLSQAARVVAHADVSFNTGIDTIRALSFAAQSTGRRHGVVFMVELGDLREGIMPGDLEQAVRETLRFPNIVLRGIGANLACRSGVSPDASNMSELSALADALDAMLGRRVDIVSGGNSANLAWAFDAADTGRINDLRLGESILLGREPLRRRPIDGLHCDAITLVAEVIESNVKPSRPWGTIAETAFGALPRGADRGDVSQVIFALGRQDTDPAGLHPPPGIELLGASSDHLVAASGRDRPAVGGETRFQLDYSALLRAMTSPFVSKIIRPPAAADPCASGTRRRPFSRPPEPSGSWPVSSHRPPSTCRVSDSRSDKQDRP